MVITNGSVQAPEQLYWHAAQTLAQHGYVVLTWDPQGQGRSDAFGSGETLLRGVPAQQPANFVEGTEDALDFALSTPERPYTPRGPGAARQRELVAAGRSPKNNPLHVLVDASRVGIAGHSLGAFAVSQISSSDPRVDAVMAWDNLQPPSPPLKPRVPALGISNDYGLVVTPFTSDPDPEARNRAFAAYKQAGVDAMQVNIRGGTHYESSYIPDPAFPATLRGIDLVDWYTLAWFDRYVKGEPRAIKRILSDRWRADAKAASVDPSGDGNLFSFYFRSPVAITTPRGRFECSDLRGGCEGRLVPRSGDGFPEDWSFLKERLGPSGGAEDDIGGPAGQPVGRGKAESPKAHKRARRARRQALAVGAIAHLEGQVLTLRLICFAPRDTRCRLPGSLALTLRLGRAITGARIARQTVPGGSTRRVRVPLARAAARALARRRARAVVYELRSRGRKLAAGELLILPVSKHR
ncbi:alpha/beta hydrolase family protein [Thermoleophilum album]|uniref:alpha/beta hydrolase family protein n=1 Tax=Thermoleophilum album TaxID=29539 RepID=UPI001160023C|nr:acetylxylan esterase [Thermoleophilum album]